MRQHAVPVLQLDGEHRVRQRFDDRAFDLDRISFRHGRCWVPNYRTGSRGPELQVGMCLAVEPMFTLGSGDVYVEADGWTVATSDDVLAAHFEHTIAITATGPEILTKV